MIAPSIPMQADLAGRTAFVSGGSSGINLAIARHLGLRGATVGI